MLVRQQIRLPAGAMTSRFSRCLVVFVILSCVALVGCHSPKYYEAEHIAFENERRSKLLAEYPPGVTTRRYVLERWRVSPYSETRPADGWGASTNLNVRNRVMVSEQRTGQQVFRFDYFSSVPAGWSGGLLAAWFYYDANDIVIDADFPYQSD